MKGQNKMQMLFIKKKEKTVSNAEKTFSRREAAGEEEKMNWKQGNSSYSAKSHIFWGEGCWRVKYLW